MAEPDTPTPTLGPEAAYSAFLDEGRFMIQRCGACARHVFFPRTLCPHCGNGDLAWLQASGGGTVYSFTVVRRKPQLGGDYNVILVDLDEGPRMMSRLEGAAPDSLRIGTKVSARIAGENGARYVVFDAKEGEP